MNQLPSVHHICVFPCNKGQCHAVTRKGSRCTKTTDFVDLDGTARCHVHLIAKQRKVQLYDFVLTQDKQFEYKFLRNTTMEQETLESHTCPICICAIHTNTCVVLETCGHRFHEKCITEWIYSQHKNSCPCCRATVFNETYYDEDLYSVLDVLESPEARAYARENQQRFLTQRLYTYDCAMSIAMALTIRLYN